jgi:hypothetical protein
VNVVTVALAVAEEVAVDLMEEVVVEDLMEAAVAEAE